MRRKEGSHLERSEARKLEKRRAPSRIPEKSIFYSKVVPILLLGMAIVMIVLILIAFGVLTGLVPFQ
jgi:hypothetical protein